MHEVNWLVAMVSVTVGIDCANARSQQPREDRSKAQRDAQDDRVEALRDAKKKRSSVHCNAAREAAPKQPSFWDKNNVDRVVCHF